MPYQGGNRAYPVHPSRVCRSEIMFPWVTAVELDVDVVDVDVDVGEDVDVEPEFEPMLVIGVEALPPQLTNVSAIKTSK